MKKCVIITVVASVVAFMFGYYLGDVWACHLDEYDDVDSAYWE